MKANKTPTVSWFWLLNFCHVTASCTYSLMVCMPRSVRGNTCTQGRVVTFGEGCEIHIVDFTIQTILFKNKYILIQKQKIQINKM